MKSTPNFVILDRDAAMEIVRRNHVGRIAFRVGEQVDIQPVGYVCADGWLFLRSAHGRKLQALMRTPYVAFEVDEIDGPFDWRSVIVHGTIYLLPTDGSPIEQREAARAMKALQAVTPDAFTPDDPVPERRIIYGLYIDEVSGRAAETARR